MKKDGSIGHMWQCVAVEYPDPAQCPAVWINKPRVEAPEWTLS